MFQDQNIFKENEEIQEEGKKKKKKTWKIPREISKFLICFHRFPFYTTYLILAGKNLIWGKTSERKFKKYSENSPPKIVTQNTFSGKKKNQIFFIDFLLMGIIGTEWEKDLIGGKHLEEEEFRFFIAKKFRNFF